MSDVIAVFVNARRIELPRGATAAMAVTASEPAEAPPREGAAMSITDARGLPVPPDAVLAPGAILRVAASARRAGGADADS